MMPAVTPAKPLAGPVSAATDDEASVASWPRRLEQTRLLALGSLVGLILLGLAWELWLAPTGSGTLALKVLPLLLPLAGLLKRRLYTFRWVSLLVWPYFAEGVVRATTESGTGAALAALQIVLCLLLFAACAVHVRGRLKHAASRRAAGLPPAAGDRR